MHRKNYTDATIIHTFMDSPIMFEPKILDDIAKRLSDSIPSGLSHLQQDVQKNFRHTLNGALSQLDLVTREEFDIQTSVLARTREKLDRLEQQIAELEKKSEV